MCFITKGSKLRITIKDIECYKIVRRNENYCISFFQRFKYEYNKKYSNKSKWSLFLRWLFNINVTYEGYHSFIGPCNIHNVKCIIPKGSLYLINRLNECCSTSIIIKKSL